MKFSFFLLLNIDRLDDSTLISPSGQESEPTQKIATTTQLFLENLENNHRVFSLYTLPLFDVYFLFLFLFSLFSFLISFHLLFI